MKALFEFLQKKKIEHSTSEVELNMFDSDDFKTMSEIGEYMKENSPVAYMFDNPLLGTIRISRPALGRFSEVYSLVSVRVYAKTGNILMKIAKEMFTDIDTMAKSVATEMHKHKYNVDLEEHRADDMWTSSNVRDYYKSLNKQEKTLITDIWRAIEPYINKEKYLKP